MKVSGLPLAFYPFKKPNDPHQKQMRPPPQGIGLLDKPKDDEIKSILNAIVPYGMKFHTGHIPWKLKQDVSLCFYRCAQGSK